MIQSERIWDSQRCLGTSGLRPRAGLQASMLQWEPRAYLFSVLYHLLKPPYGDSHLYKVSSIPPELPRFEKEILKDFFKSHYRGSVVVTALVPSICAICCYWWWWCVRERERESE